MAVDMSHRLGWIDDTIVKRVLNILQQAKLPTAPPEMMTVEKFKNAMAVSNRCSSPFPLVILLRRKKRFFWQFEILKFGPTGLVG